MSDIDYAPCRACGGDGRLHLDAVAEDAALRDVVYELTEENERLRAAYRATAESRDELECENERLPSDTDCMDPWVCCIHTPEEHMASQRGG